MMCQLEARFPMNTQLEGSSNCALSTYGNVADVHVASKPTLGISLQRSQPSRLVLQLRWHAAAWMDSSKFSWLSMLKV
jgi:hypothetical protein